MSDLKGIFLGLALTIFGGLLIVGFGAALMSVSENLGIGVMFGVAVLQFLYVVPAYLAAKKNNNSGLKIGLIIGASLVFLSVSACGLLLWGFSGADFR